MQRNLGYIQSLCTWTNLQENLLASRFKLLCPILTCVHSEAGWPNKVIQLCSWHVNKDIKERLSSTTTESIHNRTTQGWSVFANHPEPSFIDVGSLEEYREMQKEIVRKRLEEMDKLGKGVDSDGFLGVQNCSRISRWFRHGAVGRDGNRSK